MSKLKQIVNYIGGFNRSVIEENAVLKAKYLFVVNKVAEAQDTTFKICGLCRLCQTYRKR